jgi:hypothetical protein
VVALIANAPWHRGGPIPSVLAGNPHFKFKGRPPGEPDRAVQEGAQAAGDP